MLVSSFKNPENWMRVYPTLIPPELQNEGMKEGAHLSIPAPGLLLSFQAFLKKCNDLKTLTGLKEELAGLKKENGIDVFISVDPLLELVDNKINKLKA